MKFQKKKSEKGWENCQDFIKFYKKFEEHFSQIYFHMIRNELRT